MPRPSPAAVLPPLVFLVGMLAAAPAFSAPLRIKVTTLLSEDPNDTFAQPVSLIGFTVGDVGGVTGDDEELTKCIGGAHNRERCFGNDDCSGGGTCANPGDNDGQDGDDGFGRARIAIEAGDYTVRVPVTELVDFAGNKYRVGSVNVSPTTTGEVTKCRPNDPEGAVGYEFDAISNPDSQSEYEVAIRIVPLDAPELDGGDVCVVAESDKPKIRCRRVINSAGASAFAATIKALNACEQRKLAGKIDPVTTCSTQDPKTVAVFEKLRAKVEAVIDKACGGKDKFCGSSGDISIAAIGFPDQCVTPAFPPPDPPLAIRSCFEVAKCVYETQAIMARVALNFFTPAVNADPKSEKRLNKCQRAATDSAADYLAATAKATAKCWDGLLAKKHTFQCPSGATQVVVTKAEAKLQTTIEKACCGRDKRCGAGGDDFLPTAIGGIFGCPALVPPRGSAGIDQKCDEIGVGDVPGLTQCYRCVADFTAQCVSTIAAASITDFPPACND